MASRNKGQAPSLRSRFVACKAPWLLLLAAFVLVMGNAGAYAQDSTNVTAKRYIRKNALLLGCYFDGFAISGKDPSTLQKFNGSNIEICPRLGWFVLPSSCIGVKASFGWTAGNLVNHYKSYSIGGFYRFYPFMKRRDGFIREGGMSFLKIPMFKKTDYNGRKRLALTFFPFLEVGFNYSNVRVVQNYLENTSTGRLSEPSFQLQAGISLRIFDHLMFEVAMGTQFHPGNNQRTGIFTGAHHLGLNFILPTKKLKQ
jgi:hypothetical protein